MSTFPKKPPVPTKAVVVTPERTLTTQSFLPEVARGVAVSMKHFFQNTTEMVRGQRPDPVTERLAGGIRSARTPIAFAACTA
jgi:NADH-quinone oxidoreductase subunit I